MAQYKYEEFLKQSSAHDFDALYAPGAPVPHAGIYRCIACGDEIGIARGQTLPLQNHHQHAPWRGPIKWQLLIFAVSIK